MKRKWLAGMLSALLVAGGITQTAAEAFQRGGIVRIISLGEPQLLNPVFEDSEPAQELYNLIFSGLIRHDSFSNLSPDLLQYVPTFQNGGVEKSGQGMVVTYKLRENLRWHDGQPLTAEDIQFTWQMNTDPRVKFPPTPGYETIRHVEIIDETTARVHFHRVYAEYYKLFRYVLPKHSFRSRYWTFSPEHPYNRHPVGSGPFALNDWKKGEYAILNANPHYHLAPPNLDQIRYQFKPDSHRSITGVLDWADQAEVIQGMSIVSYDYLKDRPDLSLHVIPTSQIEHLNFNLENAMLADLNVRRAIAMAVDRKRVSEILLGLAQPAFTDQHQSSWKYNPAVENYYRYQPEQARQILERAGWEAEDNNLRYKSGEQLALSLTLARGNKTHALLGEYLQQALREVGIVLTLRPVPPEVLVDDILPEGDYEIAFGTWRTTPKYSSYQRWHSNQVPPKGLNYTRFSDYQVDKVLNELENAADLRTQRQKYFRLAELLAERLPALPLYFNTVVEAQKRTLHNYYPNTYTGTTWNSHEWWLE